MVNTEVIDDAHADQLSYDIADRIENELDKNEILTLYLNKIFLGQRAYGVGAAAEVYFGKTVDQLSLAEAATIAGLPKAPSRDNPVTNPERALSRRAYVLRRMLETGHIDAAQSTLPMSLRWRASICSNDTAPRRIPRAMW